LPAHGDERPPQTPPAIDQRLLEGLDDLPSSQKNSAADIAGEDLGVASSTSTLAGLSHLMRGVEQRLRQSDTSKSTTQLQSDIAAELAKMLEAAEQRSASQAATAAAAQASDQTGKTNPDGTDGDARPTGGDPANDRSDLLNAVWGTLPERLRQQIQSPLQEEFLPRYERVIEQYYKRLADQQRQLRN
jgi:hypothetical protein